jgi:hypothetical protein
LRTLVKTHFDIKPLTQKIDRVTKAVVTEFGTLNQDQLNWKPHASVWSIAQNLDHLIVINTTYFNIPKQLRAGNYSLPWMAKFNFMVNFLGKTILKSVEPAAHKKIKTFPIWEPSKSKISGDVVPQFVLHQIQLKDLITNSTDLIERGAVISSPANRAIVYKLEMAFQIIAAHEERHLRQAREVLRLIKK